MHCTAIRRLNRNGGEKMRISIPIILTGIAILIISTTVSQGYELNIKSNQTTYTIGDSINITAEITNTKNEEVTIVVEAYLEDMNHTNPPYPIHYSLTLNAYETRTIDLFNITVDDSFYSSRYVVNVNIIEGEFRVYEDYLYFEVSGTLKDMYLEIQLSTNPTFTSDSSVFIKNEKIYLGYQCDAEDVLITANLIYPDNSTISASLPFDINAEENGVYILKINASADGYRSVNKTKYFAVIGQEPFLDKTGQIDIIYLLLILAIIIFLVIIIVILKFGRK